jgi:hypothetical protein
MTNRDNHLVNLDGPDPSSPRWHSVFILQDTHVPPKIATMADYFLDPHHPERLQKLPPKVRNLLKLLKVYLQFVTLPVSLLYYHGDNLFDHA